MYQIGACMQVDADRFNAYRNSEPQCAKQFRVVPMSDIRRINVLRAHWQYVRYDCLASDALRSFKISKMSVSVPKMSVSFLPKIGGSCPKISGPYP